ncbi:hypothetical protein [Saccharopolyspora griseoalba]|uniref:PE domain-containing protein n=1 Tax=Saccharopolyspora griseoalba TaxID=1431848 RepID=A0ABW2LIC3_9PSEU
MTGFGSGEEMTRLANTLTTALDGLRQTAEGEISPVDAGQSTAEVTAVLASFFDVTGGMVNDLQGQAEQVPNARTDYERTDDAAAQGLPPVPLPSNGGN